MAHFPLSRAQERLWFIDQMTPGNPAYNLSICFRYDAAINLPAMERAFNTLILRHEALRTTFGDQNGSPVQVIHPTLPITLPMVNLRNLPKAEREAQALVVAEQEAQAPFDLKQGPLIRSTVVCLDESDYLLLWSVHHIVFDGSCGFIFPSELHQLYEAYCEGRSVQLPDLPIQYVDYAVWQREWMRGESHSRSLDYWKHQLSGVPLLDLPTDHPRSAVYTYKGGRESMVLPRAMGEALNRIGRESGATLFMTMLAGFQLLLSRYSGQKDIAVGTPVANRNRVEVENVVGMFVNTLVLRTRLDGNRSFRDLLTHVAQVCTDAYAHQELPFEDIVHELNPERNLGHQPLFQVMFHLNNTQASFRLQDDHCVALPHGHMWLHGRTALFDLTLMVENMNASVRAEDDALYCVLEYSTDIFKASTIKRMLAHYRALLEAAIADPDKPAAELNILTEREREQILYQWNGTSPRTVKQETRTLHEIFQERAESAPEAIAVTFGSQQISYGELNQKADQLAWLMQQVGVGPESIVGVMIGRSVEMVVSLLAVLKAGGAYLPLEPDLPAERLSYQLQDSGATCVLTTHALRSRLNGFTGKIVTLDDAHPELRSPNRTAILNETSLDNAAYVIYTSGSTGRPKGVVVTHGNVVRLLTETASWYQFTKADVWTLYHSFAFDFSVWEIWGALLCGGRLVVVPYEASRSPEEMLKLLGREKVTVLNQTPSAFRQLMDADERQRGLGKPAELALRYVIFGGEALEFQTLRPWFAAHPDSPQLVNMYGITETTVHVTYRPVAAGEATHAVSSSIGVPIPDLQIYLADENLNHVPVGVIGEICVGGTGLARGYLGQPARTAEKFVPNPFSSEHGARLYRSGDLGRYRQDGDIEYMGRLDHQVKIRGFRIELGEIESRLLQHSQVREAVVVTGDVQGERQINAYFVPMGQHAPTVEDIRKHLGTHLPEYMVPAAFIQLQKMPLTANGKLDRTALPLPGSVRPNLEEAYVEPQSPFEKTFAKIWSQVLGIATIGIHDNFFALGGDSIRSLQVLSLARQQGLQFNLQQLFRHQTIARLAELENAGPAPAQARIAAFALIDEEDRRKLPIDVVDAYPLLTLQSGMLFHSNYNLKSSTYHDIFSYQLRAPLDAETMKESLREVCRRHPVLRTSFDLATFSEPLQLVHGKAEISLLVEDLRSSDWEAQEQTLTNWMDAEAGNPLDCATCPLLRATLHRRTDSIFQFTLSFHHAILDGWSMAVLFNDVFQHYFNTLHRTPLAIAEPDAVFRDFVAAERKTMASDESRAFWVEAIQDCSVTQLPRRNAAVDCEKKLGVREVKIPSHISFALEQVAQATGTSRKSVVLAAHLKVMSVISGQNDVLSGVVTNGRPETEGTEKALGLFLNVVPFRARLAAGSWGDLIREVFRTEQELLPHRIFPLGLMQHNWHEQPLFEVVFNYIHFHSYRQTSNTPDFEILGGSFFEETNFPLFVEFFRDPLTQAESLSLRYDAMLLDQEFVENVAGYYERVIHKIALEPSGNCAADCMLSAEEQQRVLVNLNDTLVEFPQAGCIHTLFDHQVSLTPEKTALVSGSERLSYAELARRSNQLAHHLRSLGVVPESRVGILMPRSADMVAAILGVLKAGGAYVPLDPAYPVERLNYMAQDAGVRVLITQSSLQGMVRGFSGKTIVMDMDWNAIACQPMRDPVCSVGPRNIAYVIYTSGSTGMPKGTAIEHHNATTLLRWALTEFNQDETAGVLASTSICFDLSIFELFVPLSCGGKIILVENLLHLPQLSSADEVTLINTVPSVLTELLQVDGIPGCVKVVNLAGEPLPHALVQRVYQLPSVKKVFNLYGPTEDTTYSTFTLIQQTDTRPPSIGRPIANTRVYLLDASLHPVPQGIPGELFISGAGLARCYVDRPDQTAARFMPDPFDGAGGRMYRTGDLARYGNDGSLEYLGRIDHQVKLRGFRIELGEIEFLLANHPAVKEAVVVVNESNHESNNDKRLVAYVVPKGRTAQDCEGLIAYLSERLPEHMVPTAIVPMTRMPLTPNGKVDRRALPAAAPALPRSDRTVSEPVTSTQRIVADIWKDVLGLKQVYLHENFFRMGGHSLMAMRVISRVQHALKVELPITALFSAPTIEGLSDLVEQAMNSRSAVPLRTVRHTGGELIPASFGQHRLWLLQQLAPESPFLNMSAGLRLRGNLDHVALLRALKEIVHRHESLRTSFMVVDGQLVQQVTPPGEFSIKEADLSGVNDAETSLLELVQQESMKPLDLTQGILLRAVLARINEADHALIITMHHIASDGWSVGIFTGELTQLYQTFAGGHSSPLKELPLQYADYAQYQRERLQGQELDRLLVYWKDQLAGAPGGLNLALDRPRPAVPMFRGAAYAFGFSDRSTAMLREACRKEEATLFMALLSVFAVVLWSRTAQEDLVVGTDTANRQLAETEGLIGMFINELVLRVRVSGEESFRHLLSNVRRTTLGAFAHQNLPFDRLVAALRPQRDIGVNPFFQVAFGLRNAPATSLKLADLIIEQIKVEHRVCVHDLALYVDEESASLRGEMIYNTDIFEAQTIARMAEQVRLVMDHVARDPNLSLNVLRRRIIEYGEAVNAQKENDLAAAGLNRLQRMKTAATAH